MPAERKSRVPIDRPLEFEPHYVEKPWGGGRLGRILGRTLPPGTRIGESWEISGHPGRVSRLPSGPALDEILVEVAEAVVGRPWAAGDPFPLLFKFLDAGENLSVQVHPGAPTAGGGLPKDEAWYILDAEPGAVLYLGFGRDVSAEEVRARAADGTLPEVLRAIEPRPGDFFHVSPGTVHAIGAGVVLAEIQQVSDTTYRLYDWGRTDREGRPRALHLEESIRHSHLSPEDAARYSPRPRPVPGGERLLEGANFRVDRLRPGGRRVSLVGSGRFRILTVLAGRGRLSWAAGDVEISAGRTLLLPAILGEVELRDDGGLLALAFEE